MKLPSAVKRGQAKDKGGIKRRGHTRHKLSVPNYYLPLERLLGCVGLPSKLKGPSVSHICKVTLKSSYHLQSCRLPKLDTGGTSIGDHDNKWPSSPSTTCSRVGHPSWTLKEGQLGVTTTNTFKPSYHLQSCRLHKLDAGVASVGGHTTNGLQFLLPLAAVPATQAGR